MLPWKRIAHAMQLLRRVVRFALMAARFTLAPIPSSAVRKLAYCDILASSSHAAVGSGNSIVGGGASPGRLVQGASGGIQVPW